MSIKIRYKYFWDSAALQFPVIGWIVKYYKTIQFCRFLGTAVDIGIPMLEALTLTSQAVKNRIFFKMIENIFFCESIAQGANRSGLLDEVVISMMDMGEETGELDKNLIKVAELYDKQADVIFRSINQLRCSLMIVLVGCLLCLSLITLFLVAISMC